MIFQYSTYCYFQYGIIGTWYSAVQNTLINIKVIATQKVGGQLISALWHIMIAENFTFYPLN